MSIYLDSLRKKYNGISESIDGLQTRAADEKRDLTEDELKSIRSQSEIAKTLATEITDLTDIEVRNRKVSELASSVLPTDDKDKTRSNSTRGVGGSTTQDRDPGFYTRGSEFSFFGDMYKSSKLGDDDAKQRLTLHNRAGLTTGANGPGISPPHWLTEEFETLARQGRALANVVRPVPLGNDPRPITIGKQTVGTDGVVAVQAAENDAVGATDAWDSDVDTVTPKPIAGSQVVSRQMLDMSSPAVDALIYADLMGVYNLKIEGIVGAAIIAAAGSAVTTFANEAAFNVSGAASDAVVDTAIALRNARKLPGNILAMTVNRYGGFLKLKDDSNRPLMPLDTAGPMNVIGTGSVAVDGRLHGLGVVATDGMGNGTTYPESICVVRSQDVLLFEGGMTQFRFEEVAGPQSIKLGIWAYAAVLVRQSGKSVKRIIVTAAS